MSDEKKFKKEYQDTYNEVNAPEELSQKLLELSKTDNTKKHTSFTKKLATAAAILFSVFVAGNGIVYAATGHSLLEKAQLYVNGILYEAQIEEKIDANGDTYYTATIEGALGVKVTMSSSDVEPLINAKNYSVIMTYADDNSKVIEEDGKFYLTNKYIKIDITDDLEDGLATGTYAKDGDIYNYKVTEVKAGGERRWNIRTSKEINGYN